jgi:nitrate/nitrite-specific signal transduction histidine kinase
MKWLQQLIERVCQTAQVVNQNGSIRLQHYSISVKTEEDSLYSIRVVDLLNVKPPKVSKQLYHDEVEDQLMQTINSL